MSYSYEQSILRISLGHSTKSNHGSTNNGSTSLQEIHNDCRRGKNHNVLGSLVHYKLRLLNNLDCLILVNP